MSIKLLKEAKKKEIPTPPRKVYSPEWREWYNTYVLNTPYHKQYPLVGKIDLMSKVRDLILKQKDFSKRNNGFDANGFFNAVSLAKLPLRGTRDSELKVWFNSRDYLEDELEDKVEQYSRLQRYLMRLHKHRVLKKFLREFPELDIWEEKYLGDIHTYVTLPEDSVWVRRPNNDVDVTEDDFEYDEEYYEDELDDYNYDESNSWRKEDTRIDESIESKLDPQLLSTGKEIIEDLDSVIKRIEKLTVTFKTMGLGKSADSIVKRVSELKKIRDSLVFNEKGN